MFEPKAREVAYWIRKPAGREVRVDVRLDERGLLQTLPASGPEWARCGGDGCGVCGKAGRFCRAALAIAPVVADFGELDSLQVLEGRAQIGDRSCSIEAAAPRVLASLMGLLMAASGCPRLAAFRVMAVFHTPFSTAEETVVRAASFWLLQRWAMGVDTADEPFAGLIEAWEGLEEVNARIGGKLRAFCETDATTNGLVFLDALAKMGIMGLEGALEALRPALRATSPDMPAAAGA